MTYTKTFINRKSDGEVERKGQVKKKTLAQKLSKAIDSDGKKMAGSGKESD